MRRFIVTILLLVMASALAFAEAQKEMYSVRCSTLWPAVKFTIRNSGYYAIVMIDNTEMAASFAIGIGDALRIESVVLNATGDTCEMQVQPLYQPGLSNDAGDLKKRVDATMAHLKSTQAIPPAKPRLPATAASRSFSR